MDKDEKAMLEAYLEDRPWRPSEARVTRAVVKIIVRWVLSKQTKPKPKKED